MKFCAFYWRKAFEKVLEINSVSDGFVIESTVKRKQKGSDAILAKRKKKKKEFLSGRIIIASCLLLLLLFLFSFSRSPGSQLWRKRLPPGALCLGTSNSRNCNCWPLTARISRFFLFLRTSFPTLFFFTSTCVAAIGDLQPSNISHIHHFKILLRVPVSFFTSRVGEKKINKM